MTLGQSSDEESKKKSLQISDDWGSFKVNDFDLTDIAVFATKKYEEEL